MCRAYQNESSYYYVNTFKTTQEESIPSHGFAWEKPFLFEAEVLSISVVSIESEDKHIFHPPLRFPRECFSAVKLLKQFVGSPALSNHDW